MIANIMLPAVVFNALAMVSFTGDDIKLVAGIYVVFALLLAVVLMFCLPGQFITPIYVSDQEQRKFVSTQLSIYTLITILAYVLIAVFLWAVTDQTIGSATGAARRFFYRAFLGRHDGCLRRYAMQKSSRGRSCGNYFMDQRPIFSMIGGLWYVIKFKTGLRPDASPQRRGRQYPTGGGHPHGGCLYGGGVHLFWYGVCLCRERGGHEKGPGGAVSPGFLYHRRQAAGLEAHIRGGCGADL